LKNILIPLNPVLLAHKTFMPIPGNYISKPFRLYTAVFLTAFTTLAVEIILSRILSVIVYYYMAYGAISIAMLGLTAGAITVYTQAKWFTADRLEKNLSITSLLFALSIPVTALAICLIPMALIDNFQKIVSLLALIFFCLLPFYFSGIIITASLTKINLQVNKIYASDLIGASLACVAVLLGIEIMDGISILISCSLFALPAYLLFSTKQNFKKYALFAAISIFILLFASVNSLYGYVLRPKYVKGKKENKNDFVYEKWNSFSRVVVYKPVISTPQYWGASPIAPMYQKIEQYKMSIDGDAGSVLRRFNKPEDIAHLEYDLPDFVYQLRSGGSTCVIGIGAGKDIQAGILFGQKKILGIDINPVFVNLLKNQFRSFAGIADNPAVTLKTAEARTYLASSKEKFDIIQMSLIDTWAATGAGAFSLSENTLYTVNAWELFLNRLTENGIFTVARWYSPSNLGETGRLMCLAVESLFKLGIKDPSQHIALLTINNLAVILVSRSPFSVTDIEKIKTKTAEFKFNPVCYPQLLPQNEILKKIVVSKSQDELNAAIKDQALNYSPPTDDNPFFFNMLRFGKINFNSIRRDGGIMTGNLQATIYLFLLIICLFIFSILTSIVPLAVKNRKQKILPDQKKLLFSAGIFFSLIGAGYMLSEIGLIQRLSILLGHPAYALGILLFTFILSTGTGSFFSSYFTSKKSLLLFSLITGTMILITNFATEYIASHFFTASLISKILLSVLAIFPLGILMGQFFPIAMQLLRPRLNENVAWLWAMNGIMGVLFSALSILISVYINISFTFFISGLCYFALVPVLLNMSKFKKENGPV
jgi:predicted membrane-bound spermidine synthase